MQAMTSFLQKVFQEHLKVTLVQAHGEMVQSTGDSLKRMRKEVLVKAEECRKAQAKHALEKSLKEVKVKPVEAPKFSIVSSSQLSTAVVTPKGTPVNIRARMVQISNLRTLPRNESAKDPTPGIMAAQIQQDQLRSHELAGEIQFELAQGETVAPSA